jgi:hypothetical protein
MFQSLASHPLWTLLALACLVWYSTITIYVAVKGAYDIRTMLAELKRRGDGPAGASGTDGSPGEP